jgi:ribosomal protein S18 acetylase RimI-like enzyme
MGDDELDWPLTYPAKDGRTILVRHAAYGDAPALHRGALEVADEGIYLRVERQGIGDLPAVIERVRTYLTTPRAAQLVGELERQVVGTLAMDPGPYGDKDRHWCSLDMWVLPAARGVGVGHALMDAGLAWARSERFEKVVLQLFGSNHAAISLSHEFGFATEGRQKNLFVLPGIGYVDNILMALDL